MSESQVNELKSQVNELKSQVNELKSQVNDLKQISIEINAKLDKLLQLFEIQSANGQKMSKHIDFIENVYDSIKLPFNYIMNAVDKTLVIADSE
jgi:uncharacterized coiled-coil DUF342 family protein